MGTAKSLEGYRVFLLEDEESLLQTIEIALHQLGATSITSCTTIQKAIKKVESESYDFFLIDRQLPDGDGLDFCKLLRKNGFKGSILFLTARGLVNEKVDGLLSGADDYLPKPFSWDELKARIFSLTRRNPPTEKITVNLWSIDENLLSINGPKGNIRLTPLEFKMVLHLISASGTIVSREELLREVWGFRFLPKTRTVDYFMGRIRKNFEIDPENPKHFLTVRGAGYQFKK
jgi:DNA-binding response OmpR family regulator